MPMQDSNEYCDFSFNNNNLRLIIILKKGKYPDMKYGGVPQHKGFLIRALEEWLPTAPHIYVWWITQSAFLSSSTVATERESLMMLRTDKKTTLKISKLISTGLWKLV